MIVADYKKNNLLVYSSSADKTFWDNQWGTTKDQLIYKNRVPRYFPVLNTIRKYLKTGHVIEAGCGLALHSWYLKKMGYDVTALDYAPNTIKHLKDKIPEVNPVEGDVFKLEFDEYSFDGYLSLGVVEHFYDGCESIIDEAYRVLRDRGYFFVSFPHMSLLRKIKMKLHYYDDRLEKDLKQNEFYQYILDENDFVIQVNDKFSLVDKVYMDGIKGLKDESVLLKSALGKLYGSDRFLVKVFKIVLDRLLKRFTSHSILLIMRKV